MLDQSIPARQSVKKIFSEETRMRMSASAKARCTPEEVAARSEHRRAKLDDEKIISLYQSGMTQTEVAVCLGVSQKVIWRAMKRLGIAVRKAAPRNQKGENNNNWSGDNVTYSAFHYRVEAVRGKPMLCEKCGKTKGRFEWANLTGKYEDIGDYSRMCVSCHKRFDYSRRLESGSLTSSHIPRSRKEVDDVR